MLIKKNGEATSHPDCSNIVLVDERLFFIELTKGKILEAYTLNNELLMDKLLVIFSMTSYT
ncbi:hypothetical protein BpHYR1_043617 [Brachionus plicatilis]|uniref:Uncharacterized protein n=1 Tax=Brachionus plicatilis TaxID=10195 RepID=A0A3M7QAR2_BRAPC|nr:hypothetical protein BpHYR1_043617 [Brachionus plicatilis]